MAKKNITYMNRAYNEVTRFVERLSAGIAWDVVLTKVAVLKTLNKKDHEELLTRFRNQGNVMVIDTKREGGDETYPVLKHKMYMNTGSGLTTTIGQVDKEPETGPQTIFKPKRFSPADVLLKATPAADAARMLASADAAHACKDSDTLVDRVKTLMNNSTQELSDRGILDKFIDDQTKTASSDSILSTLNKEAVKPTPVMYGLSTELYASAASILSVLKDNKAGLTRTKLADLCTGYHRLNRNDRLAVITALIRHAGVVDYRSPNASDARSATALIHPDHAKGVVYNKNADTDASERAEKEKVITVAKPLPEVAPKKPRLNGYRGDKAMNTTDIYQMASQLHEFILRELSEKGTEYFLLRSIYVEFPEYGDLDDKERELVSKQILAFRRLHTYRGERTDNNISYVTVETYNEYMGYNRPATVTGDTIVYSTGDNHNKPSEKLAASNSTKALEKPTVTNYTTAPTVAAPVSAPGLDASAFSNMATMLQQAAAIIENKQINDLLMEELVPLKAELNENFTVLQESIELVLTSTTAMGITIEKLNNLLK